MTLILRSPRVDAQFLPGQKVSILKLTPPHLTAQFSLEHVTNGIVMTRMNLVIQYLRFQLFRAEETVSSASDAMSLLTVNDSSVNDSSTRRLLFFGENLADGGGLFRGEVRRHANFEGTAVMHVYTHLPFPKAYSDFAFTKIQ